MSGTQINAPLPSPSAHSNASQSAYAPQFAGARPSASPVPTLQHQASYGTQGSGHHAALPPTPIYHQPQHYNQYPQAATTPVAQQNNPLANYNQYQAPPPRVVPPAGTPHASAANAYNPPRAPEVYTLAEGPNSSIPADIRAQFHHDEYGKVIFYTAPPLDVNRVPEETRGVSHSLRYLADKARGKEELERKRKARAAELELEATEKLKRMKANHEAQKELELQMEGEALGVWVAMMEKGTDELFKQMYGDEWEGQRALNAQNLAIKQAEAAARQKERAAYFAQIEKEKEVKITGFKF